MKIVCISLLWVFGLIVVGSCAAAASHEDGRLQGEIDQLAEQQAVQTVQLQDARDRVRALEVELDRLAPRTPRTP